MSDKKNDLSKWIQTVVIIGSMITTVAISHTVTSMVGQQNKADIKRVEEQAGKTFEKLDNVKVDNNIYEQHVKTSERQFKEINENLKLIAQKLP